MHIYLSELGLNASQKLLMGREFCLPYWAYLHQKLEHSFKQKAETHTETTISKENSSKTKSGGLIGKSLSAVAEWGNSNLLTNTAWTLASPGKPVIPHFMTSSKFYPIPFVFPHIPTAGSCLPTRSGGCCGLCDTRVCLCVHMHIVAPGVTDPSRGVIRSWSRFFGVTLHGWVKAV